MITPIPLLSIDMLQIDRYMYEKISERSEGNIVVLNI